MNKIIRAILFCVVLAVSVSAQNLPAGNPIIPGYYADPAVIQDHGKFYIYATLDPWGDNELGLWESSDFKNWTLIPLNWPTKDLCTSPTSNGSKVWAPSVVKGKDGKFHMFVSVGSEVYAGVADKPEGPWRNAVEGDKPLITTQAALGIHTIDAEAFIDDGQAYLYWGSGLHWVNGHCLIAKLNKNMNGLDGEWKDITPEHYFEGPYMFKQNGTYYLTYSEGLCTDHTYKVQYSTSKSPYGPFTLGKNSPILSSDLEIGVKGPGHHTILTYKGKQYIIYHRISSNEKALCRQICIDKLEFDADGNFKKVVPTNVGVNPLGKVAKAMSFPGSLMTASSFVNVHFKPGFANDGSYATLWKPLATDSARWLKADLGRIQTIICCEIRFEFPNRVTRYKIEYSTDNISWLMFADKSNNQKQGSPMVEVKKVKARYVRITLYPIALERATTGIWEFVIK